MATAAPYHTGIIATVTATGAVMMFDGLPTFDPANAGQAWLDTDGTIKVSAGPE
jgi:hypothetical protein